MKRLWISALLLVALFVTSIAHTQRVAHITEDISALLEQSAAAATADDWSTAHNSTAQAMELWEQTEPYFSVMLCHSNTDEVSTAFQEVLGFLAHQSAPEYASANATLIAKVEHLAEIEALNWSNLL